jgi:hypothetical protein
MAAAKPRRRSRVLIAALLCAIACGVAYTAYSVIRPRNETVYYELMEHTRRPHVFGPKIDQSELATYDYAYVKVDYDHRGEVTTVTKFLRDGSIQFIFTYEHLSWGEVRETQRHFDTDNKGGQFEKVENGWMWISD